MQVFTTLRFVALEALLGLAAALPAHHAGASSSPTLIPYVVTTPPPLSEMAGLMTLYGTRQPSTASPSLSARDDIHTKVVRSVVTVFVKTTVGVIQAAPMTISKSSSTTIPTTDLTTMSTMASTTTSAPKAAITIGSGYDVAAYADGAIIRAPLDCHGKNTYLGVKQYPDGKFDAARCIEVCREDDKCHFVNTWMWHKNGTAMEQHCALYSKSWPTQFLVPVKDYVHDVEASDSWGFTLDDGKNHQACVPVEA